ncbi:uncharacterized protein LOC130895922 [Diorhabda carinulata]|uniref:uncharacterized protein LOC130895922 n=1 Tax=Diorhabda carinulata TaxID=1163345 RepID=UPI0025A15CBA|nr:uncharacterized protein LOC130895922 [Diorhabda carinulata]
MLSLTMAKNRTKRNINLDELSADLDKIYDLIDEIGSDFDVDSDEDDDIFESPTIVSENSDGEGSEESSNDEKQGSSKVSKKTSSSDLKWIKMQFEGKDLLENITNDNVAEVLSPWGYFSKYLNNDFLEVGAELTSRYHLQQTDREIKPKIT